MAIYRVQSIFQSVSGIPKDSFVHTSHWLTNQASTTPDVAEALGGHVAAAYNTVTAPGTLTPGAYMSKEVQRSPAPVSKVYDASVAGSPLATVQWLSLTLQNADQGLPAEVACCLSYHADLTNLAEEAPDAGDANLAVDRPASRARGRIYFGPLNTVCLTPGAESPTRPSAGLINALIGMADFLASPTNTVLTAVNTRWAVFSRAAGGVALPVAGAWVDNAFDTQRRRGGKATGRTKITLP